MVVSLEVFLVLAFQWHDILESMEHGVSMAIEMFYIYRNNVLLVFD